MFRYFSFRSDAQIFVQNLPKEICISDKNWKWKYLRALDFYKRKYIVYVIKICAKTFFIYLFFTVLYWYCALIMIGKYSCIIYIYEYSFISKNPILTLFLKLSIINFILYNMLYNIKRIWIFGILLFKRIITI